MQLEMSVKCLMLKASSINLEEFSGKSFDLLGVYVQPPILKFILDSTLEGGELRNFKAIRAIFGKDFLLSCHHW